MQTNHLDHEKPSQQKEKSPAEILMPSSLKPTSDPIPLANDDKNNMNNNAVNDVADELGQNILNNNVSKNEDQMKTAETMEDYEYMNTKPLVVDTSGDDNENELMWTPSVPKRISMRKSSQPESLVDSTRKNNVGQNKTANNNNYEEDLMAESKAAFWDKFMYENDSNWKRERGANGDFVEDFRLRFPWKRIAYIGVLLVLGVTCAILAFMKLCGGADWMNTATFSVIIMGTVMLLPPGLYYGRILICISCRCKGYTLWDVPAGPFGSGLSKVTVAELQII